MINADECRRELAVRMNEVLPDGFLAYPTEDGIGLDAPDDSNPRPPA
jgi:hypothetical protein